MIGGKGLETNIKEATKIEKKLNTKNNEIQLTHGFSD